jgi:hypothetical protein
LDLAALVLGIVVPLLLLVGLAGLYVKLAGLYVKCRPQVRWLSSIGLLISFAGAGWATVEAAKDAPKLYRQMGERSWWTHGVAQECGFCLLAKLSQMLSDPLTWLLAGLSIVGLTTVQYGVLRHWSLLLLVIALFGWVYQLTDDVNGLANLRSVHVAFGLLFSLGWMLLGYALWYSVRNND